MAGRLRQVAPLAAWLATLAMAIVLSTALGSGPLAAPPLADTGGWGTWVASREPVVATAAVLRLVVLALAWYLVGVTTVGAVARWARAASLVRVTDAVGGPLVRRVLQASLGVGLATAVVAAATPGPAHGRPAGPTPVATTADDAAGPGDGALAPLGIRPADRGQQIGTSDPPDAAAPAMRPLRDAGGRPVRLLDDTTDDTAPGPAAPRPAATAGRRADDDAAVARDTWTVASGEHLWAIAEAHLRATQGSAPGDEAVADYWQRLIEANRGRLVDPEDPDLIVPGQVFVLPAVQEGR